MLLCIHFPCDTLESLRLKSSCFLTKANIMLFLSLRYSLSLVSFAFNFTMSRALEREVLKVIAMYDSDYDDGQQIVECRQS